MTTSKTLVGLLILAAGLVFYLYQSDAKDLENKPFIAALSDNDAAINNLSRVVVTQGGQQYDMRQSPTGWHLNEGFYVRMDSLFQWAQALKNAQLIEAKTANPDNFSALSLTEDDLRVRLYQNQKVLADVILGQSSSTPGARFVRYAGDKQSWLASGLNELNSSKEVWQLSLIFDIQDTQVQAIEWTAENTLNLIKENETGQWQQAGDQTGQQPLDQEKIASLAGSLSGFRVQDARYSDSENEQPRTTFIFGLEKGRKITLAVFGNQAETYVKVTDSQQPERYLGWQFTVPEYKLSTLNILQSSVINPSPEAAVDTETESQPFENQDLEP
jgi:hypothetical protein